LGFTTVLELVGRKPLPDHFIEDFNYYTRAYKDAFKLGDPYAVRDIGTGFLYPPPALLIVGLYAQVSSFMPRIALLSATNILLVSLTVYAVGRRYGYTLSDIWWWFPLALGFAPFLETLLLGQINVMTHFGILLMFLWQDARPLLSGAGLALGIVTKATPLAFLGYLLVRRNLKAIVGTAVGLVVFCLLAGWAFGWHTFTSFFDVFKQLLEIFPLDPNSHSFVAVLNRLVPLPYETLMVVHRGLTIYMIAVFVLSGIITTLTREPEPLFIILCFGLALMPNVMWYHHYVFFLLPVIVWLAWRRRHPAVAAWCFLGLTLIQMDRLYSLLEATNGALAHGFGHLSILMILVGQLRRFRCPLKGKPSFWKLLRRS
jgi:alpha-1,2-mannosyltransferase